MRYTQVGFPVAYLDSPGPGRHRDRRFVIGMVVTTRAGAGGGRGGPATGSVDRSVRTPKIGAPEDGGDGQGQTAVVVRRRRRRRPSALRRSSVSTPSTLCSSAPRPGAGAQSRSTSQEVARRTASLAAPVDGP